MLIAYKDLFSDSTHPQNILVLTVNQALNYSLRSEFHKQQQAQDTEVWSTPNVMPLSTWLEQIWQRFEPNPKLLLSHLQEIYLWQSIVKNDSMAALALDAWNLLHLWNLNLSELDIWGNEESQAFQNWAQEFREQCKRQQWLSKAEIAPRLIQLLADPIERKWLPAKIYLLGFDELAPAYQRLFQILETYCDIIFLKPPAVNSKIERLELFDTEHELKAMIQWTQHEMKKNPAVRIACIIPELSELRSKVDNMFTNYFGIEKIIPNVYQEQTCFMISAGKPLLSYELISSALAALQFLNNNISSTTAAHIFQTPYLKLHHEDYYLGAQLDVQLAKLNVRTLTLEHLFTAITPVLNHYPHNTWLRRLQNLSTLVRHTPAIQSPSQWAHTFCELLNALGWPGGRGLVSEEYQLHQRWQELIQEYSSFDLLVLTLNIDEALQLLNNVVKKTQFQMQQSQTPIQIMGHLEASGLFFDKMWIMGLSSDSWPPRPNPNPFIPFALQKKHHIPHATAKREFDYSQQILQRLFSSAKEIIVSSPRYQNDILLNPSSFIKNIQNIDYSVLNIPYFENYIGHILNTGDCEQIIDDQVATVSPAENLHLSSKMFEYQSNCGFKAFAKLRLQTESNAQTHLGVPPAERGTATHRILELLWNELKTQDQLLQYNTDELRNLIQQTINTIFHKSHAEAITQFAYDTERERLAYILLNWLELEKKRPPFKVLQQETKRRMTIGPLTINVQIDRIDELFSGKQIVIDYKTSNTDINSWNGERIKNPQLPLYCVFGTKDQAYSGITFAQIHCKKIKFNGLLDQIS